jgi:hypothetical protein
MHIGDHVHDALNYWVNKILVRSYGDAELEDQPIGLEWKTIALVDIILRTAFYKQAGKPANRKSFVIRPKSCHFPPCHSDRREESA